MYINLPLSRHIISSLDMSLFLTLPREIRDQCYSTLLQSVSIPLPTILQARKKNTRRDPDDVSATKIRYSHLPPPKSDIEPLLFVNKRVHDEVRDAIAHHQKCSRPALTLDLILEDLKFYYTTWLSILPFSLPIETMNIQIRPFVDSAQIGGGGTAGGSLAVAPSQASSPFNSTWRLGQLLNRFLINGPRFLEARGKLIVIQNVVIDVLSSPPEEDKTSGVVPDGAKKWEHSASQASLLVAFMNKHIDGFLIVKSKKWHVPWGPILLSRIRRLTICLDGEVLKEFDVETQANICGVDLVDVEKERKKMEPQLKNEEPVVGGRRYQGLLEAHYRRSRDPLRALLEKEQREGERNVR